MKLRSLFAFAAACLWLLLVSPLFAEDSAAAAPKGEILKHTFKDSKIFPGTVRDYSIYVPKQYDPAKPACVYVNQDGVQFNAPGVFDQLIAKGEMPVTIGVFIPPGRVPATKHNSLDRFNRSFEYDGLGDAYARFLLDELLPDVETKQTADGRQIHLSKSGNDRCIGGSSSGAICAFTAAWERPDAFSRVFSAIGTYVGLRGGNEYPTLIRKVEPKPLRIFLQDGSADQNIYGGDWWMANQEMERSLVFAGYEVNHAWGDGGHNGDHATKILPEAMRWLWKDWPAPIKAGAGSPQLKEILVEGEGWKLAEGDYKSARALAVNAKGEVYFVDPEKKAAMKVGLAGGVSVDTNLPSLVDAQAFGPDGRLVVAGNEGKLSGLTSIAPDGAEKFITTHVNARHVVALQNGAIYMPNFDLQNSHGMMGLCYCSLADNVKVVDRFHVISPGGIASSPDQSLLYLSDRASHWVYSYQIHTDGTLENKQAYYHIHVPDTADSMGGGALRVDRDGRLYVATNMGVQICDQAGRVNCIVPLPDAVSDIEFGGEKFDTLFAVSGDRIYQRKLKVRGAPAFEAPHKPAAPRL